MHFCSTANENNELQREGQIKVGVRLDIFIRKCQPHPQGKSTSASCDWRREALTSSTTIRRRGVHTQRNPKCVELGRLYKRFQFELVRKSTHIQETTNTWNTRILKHLHTNMFTTPSSCHDTDRKPKDSETPISSVPTQTCVDPRSFPRRAHQPGNPPLLAWVWTSNRPDAFASMQAQTPRPWSSNACGNFDNSFDKKVVWHWHQHARLIHSTWLLAVWLINRNRCDLLPELGNISACCEDWLELVLRVKFFDFGR